MNLGFVSGIALSALAAVVWAVGNILIRIGTERGDVGDATVVVMGVNLALVVPPAIVISYPAYGLSWPAVGAFAAAGVTGLVLGRLALFAGIQSIGASRTTPIVSSSTLVSAGLAVWLLDESVTVGHAVGIVLIVGGVAVISWVTATDADRDESIREVGASLAFPLAAAAFLGLEPVLVRVGLDEGTPIPVGLAVMMTAAFASYVAYRRLRGWVIAPPRTDPNLRWYVGAGLASAIGLVVYFAALEAAPVVIVVPIIQTSPLLVIALSAVLLPRRLERVTWRLVAGAIVVVIGATLVSVSG